MINKLLSIKAWPLFALTFGIPFALQSLLFIIMAVDIASQANPTPEAGLGYMALFPIAVLPALAVMFAWYWAVTIGLQKKLPENVTMNIARFKLFFAILVVHNLLFIAFFMITTAIQAGYFTETGMLRPGSLFALIFPLHLFAMFCMIHTMYFVAKTFKTVELQREATFSDFAGEFFLIWFYPIGIWIIQPKINKMVE